MTKIRISIASATTDLTWLQAIARHADDRQWAFYRVSVHVAGATQLVEVEARVRDQDGEVLACIEMLAPSLDITARMLDVRPLSMEPAMQPAEEEHDAEA